MVDEVKRVMQKIDQLKSYIYKIDKEIAKIEGTIDDPSSTEYKPFLKQQLKALESYRSGIKYAVDIMEEV